MTELSPNTLKLTSDPRKSGSIVSSFNHAYSRSAMRWVGRWIMGLGVLHCLIGFVLFAAPLREIVAAGLWNTLSPRSPERYLAFWFLFGGVATVLVGYLADWIERVTGSTLPRSLGWTLLAISVAAVILTPVSGFWLLFPPAIGALAQSRSAATPAL